MANKRKQISEEQRRDAVQYIEDHPDLTMRQCAESLGIGLSTLQRFKAQAKKVENHQPTFVGSGNYSSECEKENARLQRELRDAQEALKILKKSYKHSGKLTSTLYRLVHESSEKGDHFSVAGVLKKLGISKSGYYAYLHHKPSQQELRKQAVKKQIQTIYDQSHQNYGAPKIGVLLRRNGYHITDRTVGVYMKEMGIRAQWVKKPYRVTVKRNIEEKLRNVLRQNFNPERPNAVWCTDITYISTRQEGFVYLTCIMDLFSRKIIAWKLSRTMEVEEILEALETAQIRRQDEQPLVIHTDQGSHFTSSLYKQLTANAIRSYSKKGYPYDNACIESFHSLIKRECLNRYELQNYWQAYRLCDEYIEGFYNSVRIHSHCGYYAPNTFEQNWKQMRQG